MTVLKQIFASSSWGVHLFPANVEQKRTAALSVSLSQEDIRVQLRLVTKKLLKVFGPLQLAFGQPSVGALRKSAVGNMTELEMEVEDARQLGFDTNWGGFS